MARAPIPLEKRSLFGGTKGLVVLAVLSAAGLAYSAVGLAFFAFTLLCLLLALRAWARLALLRVETSAELEGHRLYPGETFRIKAAFHNAKPLPVRIRLELAHPEGLTELPAESAFGEAALRAFGGAEMSWCYRAEKRGVYRLGPAGISSGDLLGLYRETSPFNFKDEIVVFPRKLRTLPLETPFRDFFGIHPSKGVVEDPAWYEGTRDYDGLRPARNIHWKASVRLGVLQEKIFAPTSHRKVFLVFEGAGFEEAEDPDGFESALELLGSIATSIAESGASFALATDRAVRTHPAVLPLGRGPEQLGSVLELLARIVPGRGRSTRRLLSGLGSSGAMGSGFVVVARGAAEGMASVRALAPSRRHGKIVVHATAAEPDFGEEGLQLLSFADLVESEEDRR